MSNLPEKFNIPPALFETIKKMNAEETEYQMKVKALMKKKGITSLGQLSPEEKKDFFNTLDAMHKAKNEETELDESVDEKKIRKDLDSGMSQDAVIGKHANKKLSNTDAIRKVIQKHAWEKRMKKEETELDEATPASPTSLMPGYSERAARFMARQAKGTLVKGSAQSAKQKEGGMKSKEKMKKEEVEGVAEDNEKEGASKKKENLFHTKLDKLVHKTFGHSSDEKKMKKEEVELIESHFKVGQKVKCIASGMTGTVTKVDPEEKGKYYTVKQDSGKVMKYAPDELKALKESVEEAFNASQIAKLRQEYGKINSINPDSDSYKKLIKMLDGLDDNTLKTIADADIKFVSRLAKNRVNRKKMKESVEEASNPQTSMKRAALSMDRAKEVVRHQKEIGTIRRKRESLRNSYDPVSIVREAVEKMKKKKNEATAKDNEKNVKSGDKLSGKSEPVEINPELKEQKS